MRHRLLLTTLALSLAARPTHAQFVQNGGFELLGSGWTFAGNSGVSDGGEPFYGQTPPPGQPAAANHFALLRLYQGDRSTITQSITLATAGTYRLSFYRAGRPFYYFRTGNTAFDVLFGGRSLGQFTTTTGMDYALTTVDFTSGAGTFDLAFTGQAASVYDPGLGLYNDDTAYLDGVQLTAVAAGPAVPTSTAPEPGTWALLAAGLVGVAGVARRRRTPACG